MSDLKRQFIVSAITLSIIAVLITLMSLILWQMWNSPTAFGIFAPSLITAQFCFIFVSIRFIYSCFKLRSGVSFYSKIVETATKYLWLKHVTAREIQENQCSDNTCACNIDENQCSCCFHQCRCCCRTGCFNCDATSSQPVYIWILRITITIFLYPVWIFVLLCVCSSKFEKVMFGSKFSPWLRSNTIETKVSHLPYSLQRADSDEVAFMACVMKQTHIYNDNSGPDAVGLSHKDIKIDHIYRVTRSNEKCRYLTFLVNKAEKIKYPDAIKQNPYPGKPGSYSVMISQYITPQIRQNISLDSDREVLLFHGTKEQFLTSVLTTGLKAGDNPGMYGKGIYLTDSCQKADRYADFRDRARMTTGLTMLVVRAALGDLQVHKDNPNTERAVVGGYGLDNKTRFREFIIKKDNHCCIEYVVHYHRVH